jgi:hypothetical protein
MVAGLKEDIGRASMIGSGERNGTLNTAPNSLEFYPKRKYRITIQADEEGGQAAEIEGISLNQYISHLLAAGVGGDPVKPQALEIFRKIVHPLKNSSKSAAEHKLVEPIRENKENDMK